MTDGCGYISVDLAKQLVAIYSGMPAKDVESKDFFPLGFQGRFILPIGLCKGVVFANPYLNEGELRAYMVH